MRLWGIFTCLIVGLIVPGCDDGSIESAVARDPNFRLIERAEDVPLYPPDREKWNNVGQWPQGTKLDGHGGDYTRPITSPEERRPDERLQATYSGTISTQPSPYGKVTTILAIWYPDGTPAELGFLLNHSGHFSYHFYPTGRLWSFHRHDTEKELHEYFDQEGKLLGYTMNFYKKERGKHTKSVWRGQPVEPLMFHQLTLQHRPGGTPKGG